ncbi:flavodoxin family protein [Streptomyces sp. AK02-01A]|uniref:flavodoxin family protein n=1 Tax=Streptomyces sp. AK02-01A TaxID=3028648 RepID=UPI0029A84C9C|nr:NAD(P)H-dependent oxidoreductase [Streptomyces sp. AK02-01A]MDX3849617.1 NAD(P)H-dependent oxidoreductase [Streptomyces sp. AK02-01A]MDX3849813.1 NAD(P)H-dependent oxidoreductase [Streptomyces sp. AK02-01A]
MGAAEQDAERKFLFLLASSRGGGNTEELARRAADGLPDGVAQEWLRLNELPLPPFEDLRHSGTGQYPEPDGNARLLLDATLAASDLVIASPLYWYSVSTSAKLYLEHWSSWMRVPGLDFRSRMAGKTMWAVTTLASEDRSKADPLIGTLRNSAEFLGMHWGGTLVGNGSAPGQVLNDSAALADAVNFFARRPASLAV